MAEQVIAWKDKSGKLYEKEDDAKAADHMTDMLFAVTAIAERIHFNGMLESELVAGIIENRNELLEALK